MVPAVTFLEGRCRPYGITTAYVPIVELLQQNFAIAANDRDADITRKVERGLPPLAMRE